MVNHNDDFAIKRALPCGSHVVVIHFGIAGIGSSIVNIRVFVYDDGTLRHSDAALFTVDILRLDHPTLAELTASGVTIDGLTHGTVKMVLLEVGEPAVVDAIWSMLAEAFGY